MKKIGTNSEKCIEYGSNSQIDKPQHGCPINRAELPDVIINTSGPTQVRKAINTERTYSNPLLSNSEQLHKYGHENSMEKLAGNLFLDVLCLCPQCMFDYKSSGQLVARRPLTNAARV